jgi:peptidoglycan/xylan/chitin deacetylase (PgdA/CDA1 family)
MIGRPLLALALALASTPAVASDCGPEALGTSRVLAVDPNTTAGVGRRQFATTLPLAPKEVVLTFDDGPWPPTTARVLDALKRECVRATFFLLGRNAAAYPALARRTLAEGHTVGHHTWSHRLLNRLPLPAAEQEINRGIAAVDGALYDTAGATPVTPFFRFPGFAANAALLERMRQRRIVVFGTDLWASDWNPMTPEQELRLVLQRLDAAGGGIVLFHDTKAQTAAMLPPFLRALKARGYRIVHVVSAHGVAMVPR